MRKTVFNSARDDSATDSQEESDLDNQLSKSQGRNEANCGHYFANIKIKGYDATDAVPKKLSYTWLDIACVIVSIISFIADVILDIIVACSHYNDGNKVYFSLTVVFIALPSLTMTGFSLRWYLIDADEKKMPPVSYVRWSLRILFLSLQLGPVLRYIDSLYYGIKSNKHRNNKNINLQVDCYKQMIYEDADATLLRLYECFLESAPQLLLQIYIFTQPQNPTVNVESWTGFILCVSMFLSLVSMSWALASYQRALRYSLDNKKNMSRSGTVMQFLWRFFDVGSRVLALGLFASVFPVYLAIGCSLHYVVMVIWIVTMRTDFCETQCEELFYNFTLGIIFIFCYFNPKDSPTRYRISFFYICTFLENTSLMVLWFLHTSPNLSYKYAVMLVQFLSFVLGLAIMVMYYLLLHPTKRISVWAHWSKNKTESNFQNGDCNTKEVASSTVPQNIQEVASFTVPQVATDS